MLYDASDFGTDGTAIQACIDAAVVDQSKGAARDATIYVPRLRGRKAWTLTRPLRIGPYWQVHLCGDGQGHYASDWGGTLLDARTVDGPAIHVQGCAGLEVNGFALRFARIGVHLDADSDAAISGQQHVWRNLSMWSDMSDAVGVLVRGHGRWSEWGGVRLNNDQVGDATQFAHCQISVPNGTAVSVESKQTVGFLLHHCVIGGRVGLNVLCGDVRAIDCQFGGPSGSVHIQQRGQPQHFSSLAVERSYHELAAGGACFRGVGTNNRPTHLTACRFYAQGAGSHWLDAPGFSHLLARDCVFESASGITCKNDISSVAAITRPTYVRW